MRSEQEVLDLILSTARQDERVRAVMLNGSRANPNAPRDCFQDFDIVYFVTLVESFKRDPGWIDRFGERMVMQLPDEMSSPPAAPGDPYAYLMQFTDGNRIDLTLFPIGSLPQLAKDSLTVILLDKDGLFSDLPPASDRDCLPKPPSAKQFFDCCNEFWWVCPYVAKGLWRQEITYAKSMVEGTLREQLMKMITWQIGIKTNFSVDPGKLGKYFQQVMAPNEWNQLLLTYSDFDIDHTWDALMAMVPLFRLAATDVARYCNFDYPQADDQRVSAHLAHVRTLPRESKEIY